MPAAECLEELDTVSSDEYDGIHMHDGSIHDASQFHDGSLNARVRAGMYTYIPLMQIAR